MKTIKRTANEAEEEVSDIKDKIMENTEAEKKEKENYWITKEPLENSVILQSEIISR